MARTRTPRDTTIELEDKLWIKYRKSKPKMEEKEKLDAIKREIERRIEQHSSAVVHGDYKDMDENTAYWNEAEAILDFINSLN